MGVYGITRENAELRKENAELRRQVEAIKQACLLNPEFSFRTICEICKYASCQKEPCSSCDPRKDAEMWEPPDA